MDLATFMARYPAFDDINTITTALSEAEILLSLYCIDDDKLGIAHGYLAAHLLALPSGATELALKRLKAGSVELEFSDKSVTPQFDWLEQTSYGLMLKLLIKPEPLKYAGIGLVVI